jgi:hypothetical protein
MHIQYTICVYIDTKQTNSVEKSLSWEAMLMDIHSRNCGSLSGNMSPPLVPTLGHLNPVHPQILFI